MNVDCGDSLSIVEAGDLRVRLAEALDQDEPVTLNAALVEQADAAGLQVLCAFFRDAGSKGTTVQWEDASEALRNAARLLGVAKTLQLLAA